jgi:hypothetical protein
MKYFFRATFTDGHTINQTQEDRSVLIPPDASGNGPSAFYDVVNYPGELEALALLDGERTKAIVFAKTGTIFVDGIPQPFINSVPPDTKRELVYWRLMNANYGEAPMVAAFLIGWKATVEGEAIQHVVTVN